MDSEEVVSQVQNSQNVIRRSDDFLVEFPIKSGTFHAQQPNK